MQFIIEGLHNKKPTIELHYTDLQDFNEKDIEYSYYPTEERVIDALFDMDVLPEGISTETVRSEINDYVDKYYEELLEYFRDDAQDDAYENYEEPEPDWDMMPGGHDDY